jgi:DMSO/TMAO reductase YedYZ molybdopterin-dependent catalytic subunit
VGLGAAGGALLAQWALHVAWSRAPFAPFSLGEWIIRHAPAGLAVRAIDTLGHSALRALALATIAGALALGAAISGRHPARLGVIALIASLAAISLDPRQPPAQASLASAGVAGVAAWLSGIALRAPTHHGTEPSDTSPPIGERWPRRRVLAGVAALTGGIALGGTAVARSRRVTPAERVRADHATNIASDPEFDGVAGLSPAVSTRAGHYVVDIDLDDPVVDAHSWRLQVEGMVDRPRTFRFDDLRALPSYERIITLSCISNPVGGAQVGNARWTGVPVRDLLDLVRPRREATYVHVEAADGYHESFPIEDLDTDGPMIAIGMNGLTLSRDHGFPARLLVPGRYGMKNVKWLTRLQLADGPSEGYWVRRGWDPDAAVHTSSRIDAPDDHAEVAGQLTVAGIAWAGARGVSAVEVSADDGETWTPAELEALFDPLGWRRWRTQLDLPAGTHPITVRATDGTGVVQDPDRQLPHPAGATGWHRITVAVR